MKKLSMTRLAELVSGKRKEKSMTQQELASSNVSISEESVA